MLVTTEVIALRSVRYSDVASIVQVYSREYGTLSFKVSRSSFSRSRRSSGGGRATRYLLYPLSLLSVTFDYALHRDIFVVRDASVLHLPSRPSSHPSANALALFTQELLSRLLRTDGGCDTPLFEYLKAEIVDLDELPIAQLPSYHIRLLSGLLYYFGIFPQVEGYQLGYVLEQSEGTFRPPQTLQERADATAYQLLFDFLRSPSPLELSMSREERNGLLRLLLDYLSYHFPEVGTLKSPQILSQLF